MKTSSVLCVLFLGVLGCTRPLQDSTPVAAADPPVAVLGGTCFRGRIAGRVTWPGTIPEVKPIKGLIATPDGLRWGEQPNHLAPAIDPMSKGLANAVVYLKAVDPKLAKAWPFEPLAVETRDRIISARQGAHSGRTGFARVGESIAMVSFDDEFHMFRARGAGFFTLPFPEPNKPRSRAIGAPGRTEFTSAAGYFWSSADVFTCEHPYYTTTDATGRFLLEGVPPGTYTLVAWHRNWKLLDFHRDPETGKIMTLVFDAPFQTERDITVPDGPSPDVVLTLPK